MKSERETFAQFCQTAAKYSFCNCIVTAEIAGLAEILPFDKFITNIIPELL